MYITDPIRLLDTVERPRFFSPLSITKPGSSGSLPHWEQSGKTVFTTFRLADSLPLEKLVQWQEMEAEWADMNPPPWNEEQQQEHDKLISAKMEEWLDNGHGECILESTETRKAVENAIKHFNGMRYTLYAYVVMPNHVHTCFMPHGEFTVAQIIHSWKSYSAKQVNRLLARHGTVWQKEYFDRYVRNYEHFERVVRYIMRNNPKIAWTATAPVT